MDKFIAIVVLLALGWTLPASAEDTKSQTELGGKIQQLKRQFREESALIRAQILQKRAELLLATVHEEESGKAVELAKEIAGLQKNLLDKQREFKRVVRVLRSVSKGERFEKGKKRRFRQRVFRRMRHRGRHGFHKMGPRGRRGFHKMMKFKRLRAMKRHGSKGMCPCRMKRRGWHQERSRFNRNRGQNRRRGHHMWQMPFDKE